MLVRQISLHNFKAFRGTHLVDLPAPTKRTNVYLFGGENGAGKTTLVQGVLLALYGVGAAGMPGMPVSGRDFRRKYASWLAASRNLSAVEGQEDLVTVGVLLEDRGRTVSIKRSVWFRADGALDEELLEVREDEGGRSELYAGDEAQERVALWMPRHLAELIFFDGEQVRTHLSDASGAINGALDRLLDLEPVLKLISDVSRLSRDKRAALLSEGQLAVLESLEARKERAVGARDTWLRDQSDLQRQAEALEESISTVQLALDEKLSGTSPVTTTQLDSELAALRQRRDELRSRFGRHLGDWFYFSMAPELVRDAASDLRLHRSERLTRDRLKLEMEATSNFAEALLAGLETELADEALEVVRRLTQELFAVRASDADQASGASHASALESLLDDELAQAESSAEDILRRDDTDLRYLADDLNTIQASIDQLEALRVTVGSQGLLDRLVIRAQELRTALSDVRSMLASVELELAGVQEELSQVQRSLSRLTARAEDSDDAGRWLSSADTLTTALSRYIEERRRLALDRVSAALLVRLQDLLHKQHLVTAVKIDPLTYETRLLSRSGRTVQLPSAGERQLSAMAFAAAILDCSDSRLPMFVDTPLARLDGAHRDNVVGRFWPRVGRQVFVLSTDEEVRGPLLDRLAPHLVQTYSVEHDDGRMESRVTAGKYFGEVQL